MLHTTYIALGTNLGDRLANLRTAINAFSPKVTVTAESHVYETPPWGYENQPAFLNMVVKAETDLEPESLLAYLKQLEVELIDLAQRRLIDRINSPQEVAGLLLIALDCGDAAIAPQLVIAFVAQLRGKDWIIGKTCLPFLVDQCIELGGGVGECVA